MSQRSRGHEYPALAAVLVAMFFLASDLAKAGAASCALEGEKVAWPDGSARHDFVMDEKTLAVKPLQAGNDDAGSRGLVRCILVVPTRAASGNPWSWRDLHRNHRLPTESELLKRGFHVAFITPGPPPQRDAWYAFLTEQRRLSRKPVLVGMSTAGELRAGTAKVSITPDDAHFSETP